LNLRVLRLALSGRWLGSGEVAVSYDRAAPDYDENWLTHLRSVTDNLLFRLPQPDSGSILDLGCGTGYCAQWLSSANPARKVVAVDVSAGMLAQAGKRLKGKGAVCVQDDMLRFLKARSSESASMVVSAWSLGYSRPPSFFHHASRVLETGGTLAFVVNYSDTLEPVFTAFRRSMARFPEQVRLAAWPRFPSSWERLSVLLERSGFEVVWHEEGYKDIPRPEGGGLSWLLRTGVLAGFDQMLPLREGGRAAEHFESLLREDPRLLRHHYAAVVAKKIRGPWAARAFMRLSVLELMASWLAIGLILYACIRRVVVP
jgi:ubiquinone/menaquinone biosynthesis C-methylase UbiE